MDTPKWTFTRDGKEENVRPERWVWAVIYRDDSELHQFGNDFAFHQIGEIDQERVKMFVMYRLDDMGKRIDIPFDPETMRLVHLYKNFHSEEWRDDINLTARIYCFGYNKGDHTHRVYILPDDRLIVSDNPNLNLALFGIERPTPYV